jgi:hypothetical protein
MSPSGLALLKIKIINILLSKINCGVIFREGLSKPDALDRPGSGASLLTPTRSRPYVRIFVAHRERGSWLVIWHSVDDREPRKQICRQQSSI